MTVVRRSLAADGPRVLVMALTDPIGQYPPGSVLPKLVTGLDGQPRVHETRWAAPPADLASAITAARLMLSRYRD